MRVAGRYSSTISVKDKSHCFGDSASTLARIFLLPLVQGRKRVPSHFPSPTFLVLLLHPNPYLPREERSPSGKLKALCHRQILNNHRVLRITVRTTEESDYDQDYEIRIANWRQLHRTGRLLRMWML